MKKCMKYLSIGLLLVFIWTVSMRSVQTVTKNALHSNKSEDSLEETESEYLEGQVIIMTSSNTDLSSLKVKKSFFRTVTVGEEFDVQDVAEFDVPEQSEISLQNDVTSDEDYVISFIQSEEYTTEQLMKKLENVEGIIAVQPNYILHTTEMTNDTYIDYQWAIDNNGQNGGTIGKDINPIETSNEEERIVAVVDTGVDYTHEDLKDVMWSNTHSELGPIGTCGRDFKCKYFYGAVIKDFDDDPMDDSETAGHGTHCAGIIAAESNNSTGVTGTNLDSNVKIMALKLANDEGDFSTLNAIYAYQYIDQALDLGENIVSINNSYGGSGDSNDTLLKTIMDSVGAKGALSICAAGNESLKIDDLDYTPATIDSPYIVTVAATDEKDNLASFSNYGENEVDIAAPGTNILSTVSYDCFNPSIYSDEKIKSLCTTYENYNDITDITGKIYTEGTDGTVTVDRNVYFGKAGGKSLKWTVENAKAGQEYKLVLLFNSVEEDGSYYASFMYTSEGAETWSHKFGELTATKGASKYSLTIKAQEDGTFTYYFDDFAFSKKNVEKSDFGKYDFLSGTSMAAPYVTGAVAVISSKYPETTSLERKELLLHSIRTSSSLQGKVATGGTLDLSNLPKYTVKPTLEISQNKANPTMGKTNELEVNNTEVGKAYEYNINASETWLPATNNKISLSKDGTYTIKVREVDDSETESEAYYYTLDTTAPVITADKEKTTVQAESVEVAVSVTEEGSGLKEDKIYYATAKNGTTPSEDEFEEASLKDGKATLTLKSEEDGNYYLYIKSLEDKVGNTSNERKFGTYSLKGTTIQVTGVKIKGATSGEQIGMTPGEERKFEAEVLPINATNQNVTWSIQSLMGVMNVATVDEKTGTVKVDTNGYGYAVLTVITEEGGYSASATILVRQFAESISFVKDSVVVNVGDTIDLNNFLDLKPKDAEGVIWKVEDNTIVEVDSEGVLTAKKVGKDKVTAEVSNKEWETLTAEITVEVYPKLIVTKPTLDLPTDSSKATWHKEREIEIQNTETGKQYQYSIDDGATWRNASDNKVTLNGTDGSYAIKVRIKDDSSTESTSYYYKLDTTAPSVETNLRSQTIATEEVRPEITVTDSGSGLKLNVIEYQFSTSTTTPTTGYKTATLTEGKASLSLSSNETEAGTYYLYVNKVKDNVENESNVQKFGPYLLKYPTPTLSLPTSHENMEWKTENQSFILSNTVSGVTYQYTKDNGKTWEDCIYNTSTEKWTMLLEEEGENVIRLKIGNTEISTTYYLGLDKTRPNVTITGDKTNPKKIEIQVTDEVSGLASNKIEYVISKTEPTATTRWLEATIEEGQANLSLPVEDGTYHVYVKPIADNAGWLSTNSSYHKFEGYIFDSIVPVTGVSLSSSSLNLKVGENVTLKATVTPNNATNGNILWSSSNERVVTVKDGVVTAVAEGSATITVRTVEGGKTAICTVTVTTNEQQTEPEDEITLNSEVYTIETNERENIITNIPVRVSLKEFYANITTNAQRKVMKNKQGQEIEEEEEKVGTGSILTLYKDENDTEGVSYTIVARGDLTGNGQMGDIDLLKLARYRAGLDRTLSGEYLRAADVYQDGVYGDDKDLLKMARILVGLDNY